MDENNLDGPHQSYHIGNTMAGQLYAQVHSAGFSNDCVETWTIRIVVADPADINGRFKPVGLLSEVKDLGLRQADITFTDKLSAFNKLEELAARYHWLGEF